MSHFDVKCLRSHSSSGRVKNSRCSASKVLAVLQELKKEEDLVLLLLPEKCQTYRRRKYVVDGIL